VGTFAKSKGRTRSERVRVRAELKERLVAGARAGSVADGEDGAALPGIAEDNPEEAPGIAMGQVLSHEALAGDAQLVQEVVNVNVSQNEDEVIVEEVLNNSVVELAADDSIEVVMEAHNSIIDLTEAEDEVVMVDYAGEAKVQKTKTGKSVEIDLTSSPMPAPSPLPMQCPVCFDSLQSLLPPRTALSTKCGHLFCSSCLPAALQASGCCPTCRKRVRLSDAIRLFL